MLLKPLGHLSKFAPYSLTLLFRSRPAFLKRDFQGNRFFVILTGFGPVTWCLEVALSSWATRSWGSYRRTRTANPLITSQELFQLKLCRQFSRLFDWVLSQYLPCSWGLIQDVSQSIPRLLDCCGSVYCLGRIAVVTSAVCTGAVAHCRIWSASLGAAVASCERQCSYCNQREN